MNNTILRSITVTAGYQPLTSERVVGSFTITAPPSNADPVQFFGDTGDHVSWVPGEWHNFRSVNLAELQVKGTPGDIVTVVGGTW